MAGFFGGDGLVRGRFSFVLVDDACGALQGVEAAGLTDGGIRSFTGGFHSTGLDSFGN